MPDITMCKDDECPRRKNCYRFMAEPNPMRQSYFAQTPRWQLFGANDKGGGCDYFSCINEKVVKPTKWEN